MDNPPVTETGTMTQGPVESNKIDLTGSEGVRNLNHQPQRISTPVDNPQALASFGDISAIVEVHEVPNGNQSLIIQEVPNGNQSLIENQTDGSEGFLNQALQPSDHRSESSGPSIIIPDMSIIAQDSGVNITFNQTEIPPINDRDISMLNIHSNIRDVANVTLSDYQSGSHARVPPLEAPLCVPESIRLGSTEVESNVSLHIPKKVPTVETPPYTELQTRMSLLVGSWVCICTVATVFVCISLYLPFSR